MKRNGEKNRSERFKIMLGTKTGEVLSFEKKSDQTALQFYYEIRDKTKMARKHGILIRYEFNEDKTAAKLRVIRGVDNKMSASEIKAIAGQRGRQIVDDMEAGKIIAPGIPIQRVDPQDPRKAQSRFTRVAAKVENRMPSPPRPPVDSPAQEPPKPPAPTLADECAGFWRSLFLESVRTMVGAPTDTRIAAANAAVEEFRRRFA